MARSTARKRALNTLYEADEKGQDILSLLAERIAVPGAQTPLPDYAIEIVRGVAGHRREIDRTLDAHSNRWKVRRMGVVDRNILRIAAWEILFNDDVPDKVAIDEALGLAKTLCDDDAPSFIHGLLSAVCSAKQAAASEPSGESADADETGDDAAGATSGGSDDEASFEPIEASFDPIDASGLLDASDLDAVREGTGGGVGTQSGESVEND